MASTNKTANLKLNQYLGADKQTREDVNADNLKIDTAVGNMLNLETVDKSSLVAAINEAALSGGGDTAPYIGDNGNWWVWDYTELAYVDSGVKAEGADGSDGADGISAFVWIKWSAIQPTQNSDMKDTPDQFIGVYSGTSPTAPTAYTSYQWYKYKGEKGDTGEPGSSFLPVASGDVLGGIKVGSNLLIDNAVLSVDTASAVTQGVTKPVTADAVKTAYGTLTNIEIEALINSVV